MLPDPSFTFTIPSLHDDLALDCRIYNPPQSVLNSEQSPWKLQGAVVAHPYAPMGGSFDDGIVLAVAAELLTQGFVVGTFNFRGACGSKGKASWQAKAEVEDYISFAGFLIQYLDRLDSSSLQRQQSLARGPTLSPVPPGHASPSSRLNRGNQKMTLVLGGYSYGALITCRLPTTEDLLSRFQDSVKGSAASGISTRASEVAAQWNKDAKLYREARNARRSGSHEKLRASAHALAVTMGGDESEHGSKRKSQEGRRSFDTVRRSMDRTRRKLGSRQHSTSHSDENLDDVAHEKGQVSMRIALPETHYLLISPLLPPISLFATMFSSLRSDKSHDCEANLVENPTLAIYGDNDFFTSQKKLRKWAEHNKTRPKSQFKFHEIAGAGHFWREDGVKHQMRTYVREWLQDTSTSTG